MANTSNTPKKNNGSKRTVKNNTKNSSKKTSTTNKINDNKKKIEVTETKEFSLSKLIIITLIIMSIAVIIISVSFGFFTYSRSGKNPNTVYTANLNIIVNDEESLGINDTNSFPVYDQVGRKTDPYKFTLENLGSVAANYVMRLVPDTTEINKDLCSDNLLADESIKVQLIKDGVVVKESKISELDDYIIDSGFIGLVDGVNSYSYELRLWISSDAGKEVMGRHYHGKIQVEVTDPNNS